MSVPRASAPTPPRFEHRTDDGPVVGIGTASPRLSWYVPMADPGYKQTAYELEITRAQESGEAEIVRVESGDQVLVPWPVARLSSRQAARARVRVRGGPGREDAAAWSLWSDAAVVEAGLLATGDWTARFISPRELGGLGMPAPVLRGRIDLPAGEIVKARLYITAHGTYVATLNGRRVGDEVLAPGWTSYRHRLRYQTQVTSPRWSGQGRTSSRSCSATGGTAGASAGTGAVPCTATGWPCWRSSRSPWPT